MGAVASECGLKLIKLPALTGSMNVAWGSGYTDEVSIASFFECCGGPGKRIQTAAEQSDVHKFWNCFSKQVLLLIGRAAAATLGEFKLPQILR